MVRALLITEETRKDIADAIERARKHPISAETLEKLIAGVPQNTPVLSLKDRPQDFKREQTDYIQIFDGYRVHISFEEQPLGLCKHLSIGIDNPHRVPSPPAIELIAKEFGMLVEGRARQLWLEEYDPGFHAVNIVELDK